MKQTTFLKKNVWNFNRKDLKVVRKERKALCS